VNYWTQTSIDFANQKNYLDELYKVYPICPNIKREINEDIWADIEYSFDARNCFDLIKNLLKLKLFPIKDSYVAYLRNDKSALERNPQTIKRLASYLYDMGIEEIHDKCTEAKETNRQIGPMFKNYISKGTLGFPVCDTFNDFHLRKNDAILKASDSEMKNVAEKLGYKKDKGIDFIARINEKFVIGETKFLTDFGGHQNAQFDDAISTINALKDIKSDKIIPVAIMDGVLYIENEGKMYKHLKKSNDIILSSLLLREFLYSI